MEEVKVIGQMDNTIDHTFESANRVYDIGGVAPTINTCGGGGLQPKIIESVKELGFMDNGTGKHQSNTVYDEKSLCPNITTIQGGGTQQIKIAESQIVAMRGRNPTNPSDRTPGIELEQTLEVNQNGTTNCLTSVQKDNLVLEKNIPCKLNKMPNGYLDSMENAEVCDIDTPTSSTVTARYYKGIGAHKDNMVLEKPIQLVFLDSGTGKHQSNTVYDEKSLCPNITTIQGGGTQQIKIAESQIVAMRGRNPKNPSDRTPGIETEQRLEPNTQGTCNTLTSVQKDNLVLENVYDFYNDKMKQDGVCGTLTTGTAHNGSGSFGVVEGITTKGKYIDVASTILSGYERTNMTGFNADNGVVETINKVGQISNDGSQYGTVIADNGLSPNLVAGTHGYANSCIATQYRIRKLTPRECWRLMDFADEDFEKAADVNSNTQLYKQAGNSIVKNVLVAIFGQMIPGKENVYKELSE